MSAPLRRSARTSAYLKARTAKIDSGKLDGQRSFDYTRDYHTLNMREHPELYRVGRGEQGVLMIEPYKSEILKYWKFATPELATSSSQQILNLFNNYLHENDFIGMDMSRKYLQMGYTRSRRYANHQSGRKYDQVTGVELPRLTIEDPIKAESARIFYSVWKQVENNEIYKKMKADWKKKYG